MNETEFEEIKRLASMLMHPADIAIQLEMSSEDFIFHLKDENTEIYKAFYQGCLQTEIDIREMAFKKSSDEVTDYEEIQFKMAELDKFKSALLMELND